jgi:crossover junction endodeoxyribonuclease RuvC
MAERANPTAARDGVLILGVDPGLRVTGYGLIAQSGNAIAAVDYGCFAVDPRLPLSERLATLFGALQDVIARHAPSEVAIEQPFVAANAHSALAIGEARALAVLAAGLAGLPVQQYSPAEVKRAVTGYGRGPKEQVQEMVRLQLGLRDLPEPFDASDALAVALCHLSHTRSRALIERSVLQ